MQVENFFDSIEQFATALNNRLSNEVSSLELRMLYAITNESLNNRGVHVPTNGTEAALLRSSVDQLTMLQNELVSIQTDTKKFAQIRNGGEKNSFIMRKTFSISISVWSLVN